MIKIQEIKEEFENASPKEYPILFKKYSEDSRSGVQKLIVKYEKKEEAYQAELVRTEEMKQYERKYEHLGYVCGIDEVGRGPLAGPVVACAVILPKDCQILYLNDSKNSLQKRGKSFTK